MIGCNPGRLTRTAAYRYVYEEIQDRGPFKPGHGSTYLTRLSRGPGAPITVDESRRAVLTDQGRAEFDAGMVEVRDLSLYEVDEWL